MPRLKILCVQLLLLVSAIVVVARKDPKPRYQTLPPLREQAIIQDAWTKERISHIPKLLQKYGIDAWLMSQKEYSEDTVFWSLKSALQFSARRRTMELFIANPLPGTPSQYSWIDNTPTVWTNLLKVLEEQNPSSIAVNVDAEIAFSSGLHAGEYQKVVNQLGPEWGKKLVAQPMLAVEFVATMPWSRLGWYRRMQETAWAMISEAFSNKVITPGKTTTEDVEWWLRSKIQEQNYTTWFHPDVSIVRTDTRWPNTTTIRSFMETPASQPFSTTDNTINHGDLLHVDFGVTAMGLNTDTQHLGYVLPPNQISIPNGLLRGLRKANRMQDLVRAHMRVGLTGNEILSQSLAQMAAENITGRIYCHAIGDWGHSAGTVIGMTNLQQGVPVLGEMPLLGEGAWYSVELYAEEWVEEWNGTVVFALEEDVYWAGRDELGRDRWEWVYGRQEEFHLVEPVEGEGEGEGEGGVVREEEAGVLQEDL